MLRTNSSYIPQNYLRSAAVNTPDICREEIIIRKIKEPTKIRTGIYIF